MSISTAYAGKEPHFPGTPGYTPLPLPMTQEEIADLPYDVLVNEIRHYLTIVEQKKEWLRNRNRQQSLLKGSHPHARIQHHRPSR